MTLRLRSGYESRDAVGTGELYAADATWELHVGGSPVLLHGRTAIVGRYVQDFHLSPTCSSGTSASRPGGR